MYRTAFLLLAAATPLAANAQTAPAPQAGAAAPAAGAATAAAPTVGATVVDTQGNTVGTIASTEAWAGMVIIAPELAAPRVVVGVAGVETLPVP